MADLGNLRNDERIGRALTLIGIVGDRHLSQGSSRGAEWVAELAERDASRGRSVRHHLPTDPATVLRALTELRVLGGSSQQLLRSYASELRDVRNRHAHRRYGDDATDFSEEDAARALDTATRLIRGLDSTAPELVELAGLAGRSAPAPVSTADPVVGAPAGIDTIECKSCGTRVRRTAMICSNPECGRNPREEPAAAAPGAQAAVTPTAGAATAPADSSAAQLLRLTLPGQSVVELPFGKVLILGRESSDARVNHAFKPFEEVSRNHVRLVFDADGPALVMLGDETGGQFGTFIGDRRLPNEKGRRFPLRDGDRVQLGDRAMFLIQVEAS